MRIGVLGTGNMADALATHWVRAGHEVIIGGRDAHKAERLATRIGGSAKPASLRAAAESGQEVVLAALPFGAGAEVARDLHVALEGKVLLDCSNPVGPGFRLLTEGGPSAAQQLAAAAPGAHVVKAFNLCHEDVWPCGRLSSTGDHWPCPSVGTTRRPWYGYASWCRTWAANPWPAAVSNVRDSWKRPPRCSSPYGSARERMPKQSHLRWHTRPDRDTRKRKAARGLSARGS